MITVGDITGATTGATYLVVDVDEVSELFCEYPASVVDGEFATGDSDAEQLVQVAGCSLEEPQHQVLVQANRGFQNWPSGLIIIIIYFSITRGSWNNFINILI